MLEPASDGACIELPSKPKKSHNTAVVAEICPLKCRPIYSTPPTHLVPTALQSPSSHQLQPYWISNFFRPAPALGPKQHLGGVGGQGDKGKGGTPHTWARHTPTANPPPPQIKTHHQKSVQA